MKHILLSLLVSLALVIGVIQYSQASERANTTWRVCASGCDFSTIALAVTDVEVNDGDTLELAGETFHEYDILLDKDLIAQ
jgi:hypothetical protein